MRPPDGLPLLQLFGPSDQFRDDVIHCLHLRLDARFDAVTLADAGISGGHCLCLSDGLLVED